MPRQRVASRPQRKANAKQPEIFDAPLPGWIPPCLPTLVAKPPVGALWRHEIKWDGYRTSVSIDAGAVVIRTRNGHDWTNRYPAIAAAAASLSCRNAVLDGEAVVLDDKGRSNFSLLQAALGTSGRASGRREAAEAVFYAFDLLFIDGRDLRDLPLVERRGELEALIDATGQGAILFSQEWEGDGADLFRISCEHELEGIVSKRIDLPYRSGRTEEWLKIKCIQSDTFVVIGYQPSREVRGALANIKVAIEEDGRLRYAGAVGTGFSNDVAVALKRRLDAMAVSRCPLPGLKIGKAAWVRPELRAEVAYRGWTTVREVRHASLKGIREAE